MNLNGIKTIQPNVLQQTKPAAKPAEEQTAQVSAEPKKAGDGGALKSYFAAGVSFGGHHCKTSNFEPKKLPDVPCCCCGRPMLREQDLAVCKKGVQSTSGDKLAATLKEYSKYMRSDEKCVGGNLRELTGQYANGILDRLNTAATDAYKSEENPVAGLIEQAREGIESGRGLDRSTFVAKLEKVGGKLNEEQQAQLQDIAMDLPQTFNHVQRIYDKYQNKKPEDISRRLFSTALTTAEHIHPHSLGGPDNTANYIAECAGCNNPRGNMDYAD